MSQLRQVFCLHRWDVEELYLPGFGLTYHIHCRKCGKHGA